MNDYERIAMRALRHLGHDPVEFHPVSGPKLARCKWCSDGWTLLDTDLLDSPDLIGSNGPIGKPIVPQWHGPRRRCSGA